MKPEDKGVPTPPGDDFPPVPQTPAQTPAESKKEQVPQPAEIVQTEPTAQPEEMTPQGGTVENNSKSEDSQKTSDDSQNRITELENEINTLKTELENAKSAGTDAQNLENKLNEKDRRIAELEQKVTSAETERDASKSQISTLNLRVSELETEINSTSSQTDSKSLEEEVKVLKILASTQSQALEMYNVLKNHQSLTLRKLSMQSGTSSQACLALLENLEKNGLVKIERANSDDTDPKVTLIS